MDFKEGEVLLKSVRFKILRIGFFGQMWPFKYNLMQHTVSEKFMNNLLDTLIVSCIFCTIKVKNLLKATQNNSQVTKAYYSLVGTSEAIRMLNLNIVSPAEPHPSGSGLPTLSEAEAASCARRAKARGDGFAERRVY